VHTDADLGDMRWLTVSFPDHPDRELALMVPGPPMLDEATTRQVRDILTKGAMPGLIFATDDCRGTYERLRERGVEFTQEPVERFYGTDCALRDPFGNPLRFTEPPAGGVKLPEGMHTAVTT